MVDFHSACELLVNHLKQTGYDVASLDRALLLNRYDGSGVSRGWRIELNIPGHGVVPIDLMVTPDYPRSFPKVGLPGERRCLKWPHVEKNNVLCVVPPDAAATLDYRNPCAAVDHLLAKAKELLADLRSGSLDDDFIDEWQTYWNLECCDRSVVSLLDLHKENRLIHIYEASRNTYAGEIEGEDTLVHWLENYLEVSKLGDDPDLGLFLWLDEPIRPKDFPQGVKAIEALAYEAGASEFLEQVSEGNKPYQVVFGFDTKNGPVLGAVSVTADIRPMPGGRRRVLMTPKVLRHYVYRADRQWLHDRGGSGALDLSEKHVVMVGCGSVGGPVAHLLAQSGIGRLTLIDYDNLAWDNVARYPEGGQGKIGAAKSLILQRDLQRRFPHLEIVARPRKWQSVWDDSPDIFTGADLILTSTAHWPSDSLLGELAYERDDFPPLLYGSTEHHALGGHAIAIIGERGCFACHMTANGDPDDLVVTWPDRMSKPIPGCGGVYSPYGAVELAPIHGMISSMAIDILSGEVRRSEHRIWIGDRGRIESLGGTVSDAWSADAGHGFRMLKRRWPRRSNCEVCG